MRRPLMKLYLILLAFLGLTGMFLYKFKYEQMKAIVEGAGLAAVDEYLHAYHLKPVELAGSLDSQFENPPVAWNNITEHHVYSAFKCQHTASSSDFCAVGFGPDVHPSYECSVLFDLGREALSVPGTFTYATSRIEGSSNLMFEFRCLIKNLRPIHRNPYLLILKTVDHGKKVLVPIYKPVASAKKRFATCLYPDVLGNEWTTVMEFLAYHDVLGVTDVIAYENGLNYSFLRKLKYFLRTRTKGSLKSMSVLHWDFPSDDLTSRALVEKDCVHRTSGIANLTAVLDWNQFIVTKDSHSLDAAFGTSLPSKPAYGRANAMRCCTESFDDRRAEQWWPTILKKTLCIPNKEPNAFYVNPANGDISSTEESLDSIQVMTYADCNGLSLSKLAPVFAMWSHKSEIQVSDILKSWRMSEIFSVLTS